MTASSKPAQLSVVYPPALVAASQRGRPGVGRATASGDRCIGAGGYALAAGGVRAAEAVRAELSRLERSPPESGASGEELQEYSRSLSVARARLKISERG